MTPAPKNHNYYIDANEMTLDLNQLIDSFNAHFMQQEDEEMPVLHECDDIMFVQDSGDPMTFAEANQILTNAGWKFLKSDNHPTDENRDYFLFMQPDGMQIELNRAALIREARLLLP